MTNRWNGSSALNPGVHAGRYDSGYRGTYASSTGTPSRRVSGSQSNRNSRNNYVNSGRSGSGRVVTAKDGSASVRPQRSAVRGQNVQREETAGSVRNKDVYSRPTQGRSSNYNRQSSTRSTVNNTGSGTNYQRKSGASERGAYRNNSSSRSSNNRSSYDSGSSRTSSSSRSGSYSSGSSSSRSSYSGGGGGGSVSSGGGGGSRGGGGGRR